MKVADVNDLILFARFKASSPRNSLDANTQRRIDRVQNQIGTAPGSPWNDYEKLFVNVLYALNGTKKGTVVSFLACSSRTKDAVLGHMDLVLNTLKDLVRGGK